LAFGEALTRLLAGVRVEIVVVSDDHVALASLPASVASVVPRSPVMLERVVVTGSAVGAAQRSLPVALDVLDGRELAALSVGSLAEALSAAVPGVWMWDQSPLGLRAEYGSIRGASSFGMSYPKVYIDGIQAANPLLVTRILPEAVERVEVIRGPQGAALYGADAISGVTNIITRHETPDLGAPRARLQGRFGVSSSDYAAEPTFGQTHLLALRLGSNTRSAGLVAEVGTVGAYVPGGYARHVVATGNGRRVSASSIVTGTVRFFRQRAASVVSPVLAAAYGDSLLTAPGQAAPGPQSVTAYTVGVTARMMPSDRWQHSVVAGVDGYALEGMRDERTPLPHPDASVPLRDGAAARGTLRLSTIVHVGGGGRGTADLTLAVEQSALWERPDAAATDGMRMRPSGQDQSPATSARWRGNSGMVGQLAAALFDRGYVTGGVRFERDESAEGVARFATLPALGAAWALGNDQVTLKLRAAYGKGIRWPETPARVALWHDISRTGRAPLDPEQQDGIEGGFDLVVGRALVLQLTRFDQTASGLIQRVAVPGDTSGGPTPGTRPIGYELQNVGEIQNRGWEAQAALRYAPFSVSAAFAQVDSRVRALAAGYSGDLQVGDRMLEVPERTISLTASWSIPRGSASLTAYRAANWINYDRVALAGALANSARPTRDFVGARLRTYWIEYAGVTHLKATGTLALSRAVTLSVIGDNLLDRQTGEPDNVTVLPGRTLSLGLRTAF
jgi:iron complex outermembrane receptor protein